MERRRRMERREAASPQWPLSTPSNYLRDVSNLRTPRQFFLTPNPNPNLTSPSPLFFTASKNSPCSSSSSAKTFASCYTFRRHNSTVGPPGSRSKAARRLKDIELEQSRSARKAQIRRQKELDCFGRSLTAWINFLLQKPKACGCQIGFLAADDRQIGSFSNGKRESLNGHELVDVCGTWRSPKRLRRPADAGLDIQINLMKPAALLMLENSLREVCSLRDMRKRLEAHMSRKSCNEVLVMMSQVCKHIDEGRLKMKPHCPIVTDLAVREKATRVLLCYNPLWLQIGLHIVFGGDSFLRNHGDQDNLLLKVFIDKHFLTHAGTARTHAVNKLVGGFYRPGYYEALGNIILKRFLLLAIALDKAKCETALHIKYGIDSIDGGSPLLFSTHSHVKSSRQMIHECLSDSMHGEGDLLAHLVILGCRVDYHQCPLAEYEFKVRNIFEDLQDGVLLCRVIQLLQCDASILSKVVCPSDHQKKHLQNCSTALKFLEGSSVPLTDSDGLLITAEDLANGDKELTCSLVWNVFVHLQVPLLINWASLLTEIARIGGSDSEFLNHNAINEMKLLLAYIQTVCAKEDIHVDSFSSLTDGRALICLIKFYLGNNIHQSFSEKKHEEDYSGDVVRRIGRHPSAIHDIAFVQTIATMLGNFPEVVDPCDIFDQDASIDERSALILLVFLTSQLISGNKLEVLDSFRTWVPTCRSPGINVPSISRLSHFENTGPNTARLSRNTSQTVFSPLKIEWLNTCRAEEIIQKANLIQLWWHTFTKRRQFLQLKWAATMIQAFVRSNLVAVRKHVLERSARLIQTRFRGYSKRNYFVKLKMSTILLQAVVKAWLMVRRGCYPEQGTLGIYGRYLCFIIERKRFKRTREAVIVIQRVVRAWIKQKHQTMKFLSLRICNSGISMATIMQSNLSCQLKSFSYVNTLAKKQNQHAICLESNPHHELQCWAAIKIQQAWKCYLCNVQLKWCNFAIKIQSRWRCWYIRKTYLGQLSAIKKIQSAFHTMNNQKAFHIKRNASIEIQRFARGRLARSKLLGSSRFRFGAVCQGPCHMTSNSSVKNYELRIVINSAIKLQRWWKKVLLCNCKIYAAISIQSFIRGWIVQMAVTKKIHGITILQASVRGWIASSKATQKKYCILLIQRWWRTVFYLKTRKKSVSIIQANVRGWLARREAALYKHHIMIIQSFWKGYLVRKHSKPQLLDLRHRMMHSAANVNDEMRLINRLVVALSELLGYRSISNIRNTCATLDIATELSKKCCETLVSVGAINILLKQIQLLNRGVPDQEVLKHVLSTLRNIARYKHLSLVLINTPQAMEIIFQELIRNKIEGFFICCQLLRRLCAIQEGLEAARNLQVHVKRLHNLIAELQRKAKFLERSAHLSHKRDVAVKKLREAVSLMSIICEDQ